MGIRFADSGNWDIPLAYDGVHFTEQGHKTFAAGLLEELKWNEFCLYSYLFCC